jgi:hypothetical protein
MADGWNEGTAVALSIGIQASDHHSMIERFLRM